MNPRRALWLAAGASLLIQAAFYAVWHWMTAGCFCSVGTGPPPSAVLQLLIVVVSFPVEAVPHGWLPLGGTVPVLVVSFALWFIALFVPLRAWAAIGPRIAPASRAGSR